jgi:predicted DNA-binding mobile mystery protein A
MRPLRRQQLDRQLSALQPLLTLQPPRGGWLHVVREALGMPLSAWAQRMGVSKAAAAQMERREREGGITLKRLERAAEALGCRLVYAIVPKTSLTEQVRLQARQAAESLVDQVEHSMTLEAQGTDATAREARVAELADELARRGSGDIWSAHEQ